MLQRATLQEKLHRVSGDLVKQYPFFFTDTASILVMSPGHSILTTEFFANIVIYFFQWSLPDAQGGKFNQWLPIMSVNRSFRALLKL